MVWDQVITVVTVKLTIFWEVTQCSLAETNIYPLSRSRRHSLAELRFWPVPACPPTAYELLEIWIAQGLGTKNPTRVPSLEYHILLNVFTNIGYFHLNKFNETILKKT